MFSIFGSIHVVPEKRTLFLEALLDDAKGSIENEAGCYRFDVLENRSNPNCFHLFEVYTDEAAFEIHKQTAHFSKWRATVQEWILGEPEILYLSTVFPSENGWRQQKATLSNW
mgnify:CR=1 FL=1